MNHRVSERRSRRVLTQTHIAPYALMDTCLPHKVPERYAVPGNLCVVTCYFNWFHSQTVRRNLMVFREKMRDSGMPLFIAECALGLGHFELDSSDDVIQVRADSILWQKERLLNIALKHVPARYSKIAWIDADVLFTNSDWAREASSLLERYTVVQLFQRAIRMPPNALRYSGTGDQYAGFASVYASFPNLMLKGEYIAHGHTGFAWAARREFLDAFGIYDGCISGSGDHLMAHAFCGDWDSPCIIRTLGTGPMLEHFTEWCRRMYDDVRARVGVVESWVLHLWHGSVVNRRYAEKDSELIGIGFNPYTDVALSDAGCWEWAAHRDDLKLWGQRFFLDRREDELDACRSTLNGVMGF